MLNLSGNLCEMGDLDGLAETRGLRIERPDGSVVTITGLTKQEVQGLDLFADVSLAVSAEPLPPLQPGEREQIAEYVGSHAKWKHCDCGCPRQRKPESAADVTLVRISHGIRMGSYERTVARQASAVDAAAWPDGAEFVDVESGEFLDATAEPLPAPDGALPILKRRHNVLEMLGYELDGVLADLRQGQGGQLDPVCKHTVTRVRERLHELGRALREAKLPLLPEPHWPRFYEGSVPAGAFTKDQMHAYAALALAAYVGQRGVDEALRAVLQRVFAALADLHMHGKDDDGRRALTSRAAQSLADLRQLLGGPVVKTGGEAAGA